MKTITEFENKIFNDDCLNVLKEIPDNSIDCIITDPPYGISFMLLDFDKSIPDISIWKECLRVLKPGAFAFIMSLPRMDVQMEMVRRLKEAGFNIAFTPICWAYASGFPKAMNISKAIDKRLKKKRKIIGRSKHGMCTMPNSTTFSDDNYQWKRKFDITISASEQSQFFDGWYTYNPKPAVEVILVCQKPLATKTYLDHALLYYQKREQVLQDIEKELNKQDVTDIKWCINQNGNKLVKTYTVQYNDYQLIVEKLDNGEYSIPDVNRFIDIGYGVVNFDECRIPITSEQDFKESVPHSPENIKYFNGGMPGYRNSTKPAKSVFKREQEQGRFPANLLCSTDIDTFIKTLLDIKKILNEKIQ